MTLRLLRMVSPGMFQHPARRDHHLHRRRSGALVRHISHREEPLHRRRHLGPDHAARRAFDRPGSGGGHVVQPAPPSGAVLNLPHGYSPEMFVVCLGFPAARQLPAIRARTPVTWQSLSHWERFA